MDKQPIVQVGGDIENALKGNYKIDVALVLKEAWHKTMQSRLSINMGLFFVLMLGSVFSVLSSNYLGGFEEIFKDPKALLILNTVVTVVISPFLAGVEMMGVFHAVGIKTEPKLVFSFLNRGSWVVLCALFTSALTSLGLDLFVIPGLYLLVALSLTMPLVVEKRLSPFTAVTLSVKAMRFQWFNICAVYLAILLSFVLLALPLLLISNSELAIVGMIGFLFVSSYLAPWFYNAKGIIYREVFGMKLHAVESNKSDVNDDTFVA